MDEILRELNKILDDDVVEVPRDAPSTKPEAPAPSSPLRENGKYCPLPRSVEHELQLLRPPPGDQRRWRPAGDAHSPPKQSSAGPIGPRGCSSSPLRENGKYCPLPTTPSLPRRRPLLQLPQRPPRQYGSPPIDDSRPLAPSAAGSAHPSGDRRPRSSGPFSREQHFEYEPVPAPDPWQLLLPEGNMAGPSGGSTLISRLAEFCARAEEEEQAEMHVDAEPEIRAPSSPLRGDPVYCQIAKAMVKQSEIDEQRRVEKEQAAAAARLQREEEERRREEMRAWEANRKQEARRREDEARREQMMLQEQRRIREEEERARKWREAERRREEEERGERWRQEQRQRDEQRRIEAKRKEEEAEAERLRKEARKAAQWSAVMAARDRINADVIRRRRVKEEPMDEEPSDLVESSLPARFSRWDSRVPIGPKIVVKREESAATPMEVRVEEIPLPETPSVPMDNDDDQYLECVHEDAGVRKRNTQHRAHVVGPPNEAGLELLTRAVVAIKKEVFSDADKTTDKTKKEEEAAMEEEEVEVLPTPAKPPPEVITICDEEEPMSGDAIKGSVETPKRDTVSFDRSVVKAELMEEEESLWVVAAKQGRKSQAQLGLARVKREEEEERVQDTKTPLRLRVKPEPPDRVEARIKPEPIDESTVLKKVKKEITVGDESRTRKLDDPAAMDEGSSDAKNRKTDESSETVPAADQSTVPAGQQQLSRSLLPPLPDYEEEEEEETEQPSPRKPADVGVIASPAPLPPAALMDAAHINEYLERARSLIQAIEEERQVGAAPQKSQPPVLQAPPPLQPLQQPQTDAAVAEAPLHPRSRKPKRSIWEIVDDEEEMRAREEGGEERHEWGLKRVREEGDEEEAEEEEVEDEEEGE